MAKKRKKKMTPKSWHLKMNKLHRRSRKSKMVQLRQIVILRWNLISSRSMRPLWNNLKKNLMYRSNSKNMSLFIKIKTILPLTKMEMLHRLTKKNRLSSRMRLAVSKNLLSRWRMERHIRASGRMENAMELAFTRGYQEVATRVPGLMIKRLEKESWSIKMETFTMVSGMITRLKALEHS